METKTIKTDLKCCAMKSKKGYCPKPLEAVSDYLSKKWTISIIITIGNFNKLRFNNLLKRLGTTAKTLNNRLKELEREKIIKKEIFNEIPLKVEYSLTKNGKKLLKSLHPLIHWAEKQ
ncbi:helix-turn-helix transcriptional regulator [Candidatus Woesearchaeota archaeon]|nr:helix-turn-helix transcriptional regulator [Candidatus Woesearchaeota archaeon]